MGKGPSERFLITDYLSRDELRELHRLSPGRAVLALMTSWGLICLAFAWAARWPSVVGVVGAVIVLGGQQLALGVLTHESSHGVLLPNRRLNNRVGQWLCAWPIWADFHAYRRSHLQHHLLTATEQDPDLSVTTAFPLRPRAMAASFARDLLGVTAVLRVTANLMAVLGLIEFSVAGSARKVPQAGRTSLDLVRDTTIRLGGVLVVHAAMFALLAVAGHPWVYALWWVAWGTTFSAFSRIRAMADHAVTPDVVHPLRHSRTTGAPWWERLTVAPHHVNFHIEHHLLMRVPFYNLPRLHRLLTERGALEGACLERTTLAVVARAADLGAPRFPVRPPGRRITLATGVQLRRSGPPERTGWLPALGGRLAEVVVRARHGSKAAPNAPVT